MGLPLPHFSLSLGPLLHHPVFLVIPVIILLVILSTVMRMMRWITAGLVLGFGGYSLYRIANAVNHAVARSAKTGKKPGWITMPYFQGQKVIGVPVLHVNGFHNLGVMVDILIIAAIFALVFGAVKSAGYPFLYALNRFVKFFIDPVNFGTKDDTYKFPDVTIGTGIGESEPGLPDASNKAGQKVVIKAKDRFLNMGIIGPIGSGKTFMTMKPMIFEDLENIARGIMANVIWVSPQPEPSVERYAESLGLTVRRIHIIDGQVDGKGTNIRFNPLAGNDIDAIISNVNIVLNEQTGDKGKGDAFFDTMAAQATTDSLQLYKYLYGFDAEGNPVEIDMIGWYDKYLNDMDELFLEAQRVQGVADAMEKNGDSDRPFMESRSEWIRTVVWPKLSNNERVMLKRAAASIINEFGGSSEGKNADAYKNIIRGLRGKVRVLISSGYVQELLGSGIDHVADRPNFSFESWIDPQEWQPPKFENPFPSTGGWFSRWISNRRYKKYVRESLDTWKAEAPHGRKGELLSVITGQTDTGKLVGRMILVFEQQAVLNRPGRDNDKPPVYAYVDEYPSYATRSINEIRTQGRKHCHSMVTAMQSRAQMEEVGRGYLRTMEGSTRHWVYLSNLGAEDAMDVSKLCGKVKRIRKSKSTRQIRMGGLGRDDGGPLVTTSESEELVDRFSPQYIRYELGENEVIYVGVRNRKGQRPLRMRINEPSEDKALIRKLTKSDMTTTTNPRVKRPERISVYPKTELVAKVKWPLVTFGGKTLFVYRWGMKVEQDMYGSTSRPDDMSEVYESQPLLLKDLFEDSFFDENPKSEEPKNERSYDTPPPKNERDEHLKERLRNTFGRAKQPNSQSQPEGGQEEAHAPKPEGRLCPKCGTEMKEHIRGESVLFKCRECDHILKENIAK
ncbi:TraM recognition domain-containing protein [Alicyclobacillus suci]|uniref:TraM recognition domain-containing protein n=1 Tax=Alicyclobacillus suci TaxID=2816080 RepID=UPI001A8F07A8|nr:TraM recognition domain-containing protein [Alicyclobacillus suci]